jgi:PAS domain S-box-containing protein
VLLPMALIYENSRRQLTQARMTALVQAGRTQTQHQSSALTEPLSLAGLLLPYLLAAGASLAIARNQQHLASLRLEEQASLERLQAVMGNSGVGMALLDPATGCFRVANLAMCRFFGLTADELQQSSWQELTHPDDLAIDQQRIEQLIAGSINQYRLRKRYRHADGRTIWGDLVVTCTRNPDGSVRDVIVQVSDVSELVAKAAYVEAASQAGVIGIWDWDVTSNQLRWDPVMYQLYGLEQGDGRQTIEVWEQALHPDDKPHVLEAVQAALCGIHEFQPRFRVVWPDGSIHHLKSRSRTTWAADGTAMRMIGVNYDVTEQAQREEQLDQQRHLLATTLDALLDPVLFLSRDDRVAMLRISELNNAAAVFFARGEDELLGQVLEDLLRPMNIPCGQPMPGRAPSTPMSAPRACRMAWCSASVMSPVAAWPWPTCWPRRSASASWPRTFPMWCFSPRPAASAGSHQV